MGYNTALDLAKREARVIITSEDKADLIWAKNEIIQKTKNKNIIAKHLDMSSLDNIRRFARDILNSEERLDVLINNVGVAGAENKFTQDGLLLGLQINYFGPFLLTHLLLGTFNKIV